MMMIATQKRPMIPLQQMWETVKMHLVVKSTGTHFFSMTPGIAQTTRRMWPIKTMMLATKNDGLV
jgi:hypothetical protein